MFQGIMIDRLSAKLHKTGTAALDHAITVGDI